VKKRVSIRGMLILDGEFMGGMIKERHNTKVIVNLEMQKARFESWTFSSDLGKNERYQEGGAT